MNIAQHLSYEAIREFAIPSNIKYGEAIYRRGGVELIELKKDRVEAWVGGLDGTVVEGAGSRRRTKINLISGEVAWHCSGNPKTHQIFCKHCVALALAVSNQKQRGD